MNQQSGFVALAVAGLWIAYLVPHRLRYRQQLLESRTDDRFSEHLRVLRVAAAAGRGAPGARTPSARPSSVQLHLTASAGRAVPGARGGRLMGRPHAARDRIAADAARRSAAEHAQRAAYLARRAAAARRRAVLTAVLLVAAVAGWVAVAATSAALQVGAVPTVLLVGVLGLGRRAVVQGHRADAAWEAGAATRLPAPASGAPLAVGRAVRPSDAATEVMARVPALDAVAASTARSEARAGAKAAPGATADVRPSRAATTTSSSTSAGTASEGSSDVADSATVPPGRTRADAADAAGPTWQPVPVPRPAYTLKPEARRPEPAPLVLDEARGDGPAALVADAPSAAEVTAEAQRVAGPAPSPRPAVAGVDLDGILARRRAAGE